VDAVAIFPAIELSVAATAALPAASRRIYYL